MKSFLLSTSAFQPVKIYVWTSTCNANNSLLFVLGLEESSTNNKRNHAFSNVPKYTDKLNWSTGGLSIQPKIPVTSSSHLQKFSGANGTTFSGISGQEDNSNLLKGFFVTYNFPLGISEFRNFQLNDSLFGNSKFPDFLNTFPANFLAIRLRFEFLVEWIATLVSERPIFWFFSLFNCSNSTITDWLLNVGKQVRKASSKIMTIVSGF